ncbi:hypothetical protein ACIBU0_16000 [Streptomyces sp. NPDC049627]|uniref:hypothetical protein n=1 Tax=Streptomyces sp. NPDC049627 TaxID=3365595 RepID=UPI0037A28091
MVTQYDGPLPATGEGALSGAERAALGKEARARVPRSAHAAYEPDEKRPYPVDIIARQSAARVPELVPVPVRPDARIALPCLTGPCGPRGASPPGPT